MDVHQLIRHPTGNRKVKQHRRRFAVLWTSLVEFLSVLPGVHVAIEWPRGCTYWGLHKVKRLIERLGLVPYHFDGRAVGLKGKDNLPIKKPWTVATTHEEIGKALSEFQCSCNMQHAEGRGKFLRETQSYTYTMTDTIHAAFRSRIQSSQAISTCCVATLIRPADVKHMAVNFVPQVEPEVMPTVRDRIAAWEKVSTDLRAACVKVAFGEDPEAHVRHLASIRQPIGVAIRGTIGGGSAQGSFGEIADLMERVPECLLAQLSSGPEGSADLLICGDSSFAVIRQNFGPMIEPEITRMDLAQFLNQDSMAWRTRIRSRMEWGRGLNRIAPAIEEELQEMAEHNKKNGGNPDRKVVVIVPWGGNDVYGDYGYAGCKWINQKRFLKTEADRKVAADWPYAQLTRVREGVERLIELRARCDVAELVVVGNAPAEDYDLPKAYNRHLGEHYGYLISREESRVSIQAR